MALEQDQIEELKTCYPNLGEVPDGENSFILISALTLPDGCNPQVVDALLCPFKRDKSVDCARRGRIFTSDA